MPKNNLRVSYQTELLADNCEAEMANRKNRDFDMNIRLPAPHHFLIILGLIGWGLRDPGYWC